MRLPLGLVAITLPAPKSSLPGNLAAHRVAPLPASSGTVRRHRLCRRGNRRLNCAIHRVAVTQARIHPDARAYIERKMAEGKTRTEALRCLKRQLIRRVFAALQADAVASYSAQDEAERFCSPGPLAGPAPRLKGTSAADDADPRNLALCAEPLT